MHHLALGALDVVGVAGFYQRAFQLEEVRRHFTDEGALRSIWLRSGAVVLMIEATAEPPRRVEGVGRGPFLVAFPIDDAERAAAESRVIAAGGELESRSGFSTYFRDPESNRCALSCYDFAVESLRAEADDDRADDDRADDDRADDDRADDDRADDDRADTPRMTGPARRG